MSTRDNRLRLRQWQLTERQRYLDELEALAARLRGDAEELQAEIAAAERQDPTGDRVTSYRLLVRPLIERRDKLTRSIATLDAQVAETRLALAAARQEMRVYGEMAAPIAGAPLHRRRQRRRADAQRPV